MISLLTSLLVSMFLSASDGQTNICAPNCTGIPTGEYTADPYDCTRFYYCSSGNPSDTSFPCPVNVYFDPVGRICDATTCTQICGACHLLCLDTNDIVADPFNCSTFYECGIAGPEAPQQCPSHAPYYDPAKQVCSGDPTVCCRPGCNPYCEDIGMQVPDPTDCTKYYYCTKAPPYPSFTCAAGEVFNYGTGYCELNGECKTMCPNKNEDEVSP